MNTIDPQTVERALTVFRADKIITVEKLTARLHRSVVTARRYLKRWNALTSYNLKGLYYTLPGIPVFDEHGLWEFRQARFTKHGNLANTIVQLLRQSKIGMEAREIGAIVGLDPRSFMHHFHDIDGLRREKLGGRYVYFSDHPGIGAEQEKARRDSLPQPGEMLADAAAVAVLVHLIQNPAVDEEHLATVAFHAGFKVTAGAVRNFLARHGLMVKKTAGTGQSAALNNMPES